MASSNSICRIGVFYDGTLFIYAQRYFNYERNLGRLQFQPFRLSVVNYFVDISALENDKEYQRTFKSLFWKGAEDS